VALKGLTVDFHEPGFVSTLNSENQLPFWFQMSDEQQDEAGSLWGPANPQALNRYSYTQNNPVRWTDPTGHAPCGTPTPNSSCGSPAVPNAGGGNAGGSVRTGGSTSDGLAGARKAISDTVAAVVRRVAGFNGNGRPIIVDSSMTGRGLRPEDIAKALRDQGYNARTVNEVFGQDPGDAAIRSLANTLDARVLTRDIGRDVLTGGGLGQRAVVVDSRLSSLNNIINELRKVVGLP
jgi:hypothetical protein